MRRNVFRRIREIKQPKQTKPKARRNVVYILPNLFTAGSLFLGILAIFEILDGSDANHDEAIQNAVELIFVAGIFDVLDGFIARLMKAQTQIGMQLDSLADLVAFGVAPAIIVYSLINPDGTNTAMHETSIAVAKATCSLFAICGALRLARFNVQASREEKKSFTGLPIPGAACGAISFCWLYARHSEFAGYLPPEKVFPLLMVVLACLMVSKFNYFGFKSIRITGPQRFEILITAAVVLVLIYLLKSHVDVILFCVIVPYVLSGPVIFAFLYLGKSQLRPAAPPPQTRSELSQPPKR